MPTLDPQRLLRLGERLRPLRDDGVLVIGSGFTTHGLPFLDDPSPDATPPGWSVEFDAWAAERFSAGDLDGLIDFRNKAPGMPYAHPTIEHFAPLFVALGASGDPEQAPGRSSTATGWAWRNGRYSWCDEGAMNALIDYLAEARNAHLRSDWRASYAAFVRADGLGSMPTDDLDAYSVAAWRLGYRSEAVRLAERTYDRLVRTDPTAAAMKATVLALQWHAARTRGGVTALGRSGAWTLAGASAVGTRGYLAYLDAAAALEAGDVATVARAATVLRDTASGTGDTTLAVLGRVVDGITALMESRVAEGYRLLDDALVPVLDERIPLEWAGDVYRLVLRSGDRVDAQHRQAWTESMRRWVVITGVVIDIGGAAGSSTTSPESRCEP